MSRINALLFIALLATGCSQLRVQVSVFDLRRFENQEEFAEAVATAADARVEPLLASGQLDSARDSLRSQATALVQSLATTRPSANGPVAVPQEVVDKLGGAFSRAIDNSFSNAIDDYRAGVAAAVGARNFPRGPLVGQYKERRQCFLAANANFEAGDYELLKLGAELSKATQSLRSTLPELYLELGMARGDAERRSRSDADAAKSLQQNVSRAVTSLIGRNGIVEDRYASVIVSADPEKYWRGTFNRTYGIGTIGNTDIAIKMDGLANFSLKGVRMDASKVTPAAFQGLQQVIKVAAAVYGVPLPSGSQAVPAGNGTTAGAAADGSANPLDTAESDRQQAELRLLRSRAAALNILNAIVSRRAAITNPANDNPAQAARSDAAKQIQSAFDAAKSDLEMD
jgi:hypothetical protein